MIYVDRDDYVLGIWTVDGPSSNVMCIVKRKPGQRWEVHCNIRHYVDNKIHDSIDTRKTYRWTVDPEYPEPSLIEVANEVCRLSQELQLGEIVRCAMVRSADPHEFARALATLPGMHSKTETVH